MQDDSTQTTTAALKYKSGDITAHGRVTLNGYQTPECGSKGTGSYLSGVHGCIDKKHSFLFSFFLLIYWIVCLYKHIFLQIR